MLKKSVWWLLPLQFFEFGQSISPFSSSRTSKREIAERIIKKLKDREKIIYFKQIEGFYSALLELIKSVNIVEQSNSKQAFSRVPKTPENLILPCKNNLFPLLPSEKGGGEEVKCEWNPYPEQPVMILALEKQFTVLASKERPLKISFKCSDGSVHLFLIKREPKGDVRKESRTMDFIDFMLYLLRTSSRTGRRGFEIGTYSIIPLSSRYSLIEWCENTTTIRAILDAIYTERKLPSNLRQILMKFPPENNRNDIFPSKAWEYLSTVPPLLNEYFFSQFKGVNNWYTALINYTKSLAFWSAFGYIIGLGDRHADNILLNVDTGHLICIDFDCIFQKGKDLTVPEIVDFRLTKNMEAGLGAFKSWGLYKFYFVMILTVFKKHSDEILGTLDSFISDPLIEYNAPDTKTQKGAWRFNPEQIFRSIKERVEFIKFHSIEAGVDFLIENNKNPECLREMFIGWCPHF